MVYKKALELGGFTLGLETGRIAKQADGACWLTYGDTVIMATVVANLDAETDLDFLPLSVDFREKLYAVGRIPGGFFKREGRPSEKEILSARLTDRPIRPLFPESFHQEVQVMISVLSSDGEHDPDVLGTIAASAAISLSEIPFHGPVGSVRIGLIDGEYVVNPTHKQLEESLLDLVIAGTDESIIMVEGEAREVSDDVFLEGIARAHAAIKKIVAVQKELVAEAGAPKREFAAPERNRELDAELDRQFAEKIELSCRIHDKQRRREAWKLIEIEAIEATLEKYPDTERYVKTWIHDRAQELVRRNTLDGTRLDGRNYTEIRQITSEIDVLPRTHGSALFTRGQTQALATVTLGAKFDEQRVDGLDGMYTKPYLLHYNFPPFSVGEIRKFLGQSRREVGHGNLAWRSLHSILPEWEEFPYTIRVVSEILESNGSSSMATVCAGCLALMAAGVPLKKPVAGIAMGLIIENKKVAILSDILGDEDHLGDMDFKVTGTRDGITACQMEIKIKGISLDLMRTAIRQAREGVQFILGKMAETIAQPRPEISPYAPRIVFLKIEPDKIGLIIGPGGKTIRDIIARTGAQIDIEDDGTVCISSTGLEKVSAAVDIIRGMTAIPEVGKVYHGRVTKITDFGAFVEILPGREGLLHISEIEHRRIGKVSDHLNLGDEVDVKLVNVDAMGKLDLSRKVLLPLPEGMTESPPRQRPPSHGGGRPPHRKPRSND
ncbi:polyribonucleotide nucleotidyltransferase [bacterium]|nr:polyribonucleotide nucleotidyltransferase [bacterium]MBU1984964.1 polyribonucleotide nucleotidyltransferase [bacterium]